MTENYFTATAQNFEYKYSRGINSIYTLGVSRIHWNELHSAWSGGDPYYEQVKQMYPVQVKEGVRASVYDDEYGKIDEFRNRLTSVDYATMVTQMYTASNSVAAAEKLAAYRNRLNKGNVLSDYMDWFTQNANDKKNAGTKLLF